MSVVSRTRERFEDMTIREKEVALGYALVLPSVLLVAITLVYPLLYNVYLSFTEVPLTTEESPTWVGLDNYRWLLNDPDFAEAIFNTFIFTIFSTLGATALGLAVALLFTKEFFGRRLARGVVLFPYIAPLIASAFIWRWIWDPTYGIAPFFFGDMIGLYDSSIDIRNTLTMVIIFEIWRYFPFAFLLILARLQSIPTELYEAARVDGASRWARFKDITLPELKYVIATVFLIRWIWNFNVFADVWLFTRDVPILGTYVYVEGFQQFQQGIAAATAMIMLLFLLLFVLIYVKWVIEW